MARTRNLVTMERVAEILGEDVECLIDIAIELEPEDGCLTVFGPGEQWFYALTEDGELCGNLGDDGLRRAAYRGG